MKARPIFQVKPYRAARKGRILLQLLNYGRGWHTYTSKGPRSELVTDVSHGYGTGLPEE